MDMYGIFNKEVKQMKNYKEWYEDKLQDVLNYAMLEGMGLMMNVAFIQLERRANDDK